jgi:hypothetical protein
MLAAPFLSGRATVASAETLLRDHGDGAATAALARAMAARANDNAVMYCRWRDVERLCALPLDRAEDQPLH